MWCCRVQGVKSNESIRVSAPSGVTLLGAMFALEPVCGIGAGEVCEVEWCYYGKEKSSSFAMYMQDCVR